MDKKTYETIKNWPADDFRGLIQYVLHRWHYVAGGVQVWSDEVYLVDDGELYNVELIKAMQDNEAWWGLHWFTSMRGGHHRFKDYFANIPRRRDDDGERPETN